MPAFLTAFPAGSHATQRIVLPLFCLLLFAPLSANADGTKLVVFDQPVSTHEWTLKAINPGLPADWTGYDFLVLEFRASSSQRFEAK